MTLKASSFVFIAASALVVVAACKKGDSPTDGGAAATGSGSGAAPAGGALLTEANCKTDSNKTVAADGHIEKCILTKDVTTPDGYVCGVGVVVTLFADGKFKGCYLKEAKLVDGWMCKDSLELFPGGKLHRCKLTANKTATPGVEAHAGDWVTLWQKTGTISRLELASGPAKIHDIPCKGYFNYFYEDGKLKKCELSEDAVIEGKKVSAKSDAGSVYVCFDPAGKRLTDCKLLTGAFD